MIIIILFYSTTLYLANKLSGLVIDLNSKLFPEQSLKNKVHCSSGCTVANNELNIFQTSQLCKGNKYV